jgi:hypothetical protein
MFDVDTLRMLSLSITWPSLPSPIYIDNPMLSVRLCLYLRDPFLARAGFIIAARV